jgi:hypothetical protein
MRKYLSALILAGALCAPAAIHAQERYYDRDHRDYHEWNDGERRAWDHWLREERHHEFHDYARAKERERRDYWRWRHDHPDWR